MQETGPCRGLESDEMDNLIETLRLIIERTEKFHLLYEQNEMAVRDQLVNPLLRALGWNPENPEEVQLNVSTEEGVPDYSLIKQGKKTLFVEAKKLSADIEQRDAMQQLAKYASAEGTKYGVLTNGMVWMLVRSFEEGTTLTERIVWKTDLGNEQLPIVCRKIVTISKDKAEQIEMLVKKFEILDEVWQSLLDETEGVIKGFMPVVKSLLGQRYPSFQLEDAEIEDLLRDRIKDLMRGSPRVVSVETSGAPEFRPSGEKPQEMQLEAEAVPSTPPAISAEGKAAPSSSSDKSLSETLFPESEELFPETEAGDGEKLDGYFRQLEKRIVRLKKVAHEFDALHITQSSQEAQVLRSLLKNPSKVEDAERGLERVKGTIAKERA